MAKKPTSKTNAPQPPELGYQLGAARKQLGKRLRDLRNHHGMFRSTVVKRLPIRISRSHLGDLERGRSEPRMTVLLALANEYRVTVNYLISDAPLHFELKEDSLVNLTQGRRLS